MKKHLLIGLVSVLMLSMVSAQHDSSMPDQAPDNVGQPNATLPDLPTEASDAASRVLEAIQTSFGESVRNLGDTLRNLLPN